jgi:hypothetical protein
VRDSGSGFVLLALALALVARTSTGQRGGARPEGRNVELQEIHDPSSALRHWSRLKPLPLLRVEPGLSLKPATANRPLWPGSVTDRCYSVTYARSEPALTSRT